MLLVMLMPSMALAQDNQKNFDYFFNLLADCPTLEKMVELCHDYDLKEEQSKKGFKIFRAPDGNLFQFRTYNINQKLQVPVVKMTTKTPKNELERILINLGYKKEGNKYIKGTKYAPTINTCLIKENKKTIENKLIFFIQYK